MRVTVYAGSAGGHRPEYRQLAAQFGRDLAEAGAAIVYGGGRVGLMGAVADGALAAGGTVVGVIPEALHDAEPAHGGVTELHVVPDTHSRKQLMAGLGDCFVALPGSVETSRRSSRSGLSLSSACTASRSCSSITAATGTSSAGSSTT